MDQVKSTEVCQLLLEADADVNAEDHEGLSPLARVTQGPSSELEEMLRKHDSQKALEESWEKQCNAAAVEEPEEWSITNNTSMAKEAYICLLRCSMLSDAGYMEREASREAWLLQHIANLPSAIISKIFASAWSADGAHVFSGDELSRFVAISPSEQQVSTAKGTPYTYLEFLPSHSNQTQEALVIIPNVGVPASCCQHAAALLCSQLAIRVVVFDPVDLSGCHKSPLSNSFGADDLAADLHQILEGLDRIHIYAASITLEIALLLAKKLGGRLGSLVLDAYTLDPLLPEVIVEQIRGLNAKLLGPEGHVAAVNHLQKPGVFGQQFLNSPHFSSTRDKVFAHAAKLTTRQSNARLIEWWVARREVPTFEWLEQRVLLLCGSNSHVQGSEKLHSRLDRSVLQTCQDVGQCWALEAPDEMAKRVTQFVKSQ